MDALYNIFIFYFKSPNLPITQTFYNNAMCLSLNVRNAFWIFILATECLVLCFCSPLISYSFPNLYPIRASKIPLSISLLISLPYFHLQFLCFSAFPLLWWFHPLLCWRGKVIPCPIPLSVWNRLQYLTSILTAFWHSSHIVRTISSPIPLSFKPNQIYSFKTFGAG